MKYLLSGTIFKLQSKLDTSTQPKAEEYMLVEVHEQGYVFQIVCISGYHAGSLYGLFEDEQQAIEDRVRGVSDQHFLKEIHRNFFVVEGSLELVQPQYWTGEPRP